MEKWLLLDVRHFYRDGDDYDDNVRVCLLVEAKWMDAIKGFFGHMIYGMCM